MRVRASVIALLMIVGACSANADPTTTAPTEPGGATSAAPGATVTTTPGGGDSTEGGGGGDSGSPDGRLESALGGALGLRVPAGHSDVVIEDATYEGDELAAASVLGVVRVTPSTTVFGDDAAMLSFDSGIALTDRSVEDVVVLLLTGDAQWEAVPQRMFVHDGTVRVEAQISHAADIVVIDTGMSWQLDPTTVTRVRDQAFFVTPVVDRGVTPAGDLYEIRRTAVAVDELRDGAWNPWADGVAAASGEGRQFVCTDLGAGGYGYDLTVPWSAVGQGGTIPFSPLPDVVFAASSGSRVVELHTGAVECIEVAGVTIDNLYTFYEHVAGSVVAGRDAPAFPELDLASIRAVSGASGVTFELDRAGDPTADDLYTLEVRVFSGPDIFLECIDSPDLSSCSFQGRESTVTSETALVDRVVGSFVMPLDLDDGRVVFSAPDGNVYNADLMQIRVSAVTVVGGGGIQSEQEQTTVELTAGELQSVLSELFG